MTSARVETFLLDGVAVSYVVGFRQMLDPEGGVALWVEYTLDADYNVIKESAYV